MATVAMKVLMLFRKRGVVLAAISVASALLAAKVGGHGSVPLFGYWDGPS